MASNGQLLKRLGVMAGLFALTACFYWRLVFTDQFSWLNAPDIANQVLPWWQYQVGEIQQGRLPLWDPYMLGGQPLLGQALPGTAYPLNWLLLVLPTRNGWIRMDFLHWYFVVIRYMAVGFAYLLCRDLKLSRAASVLGGLVFGLGGFMAHIDWPQMVNGAVWGPLIVMFLLRVTRGERVRANAAAGGMCLGVAFLSGHHQVPIYYALMSGFVWVWMFTKQRLIVPLAIFFAIAGLTSGLQTLPGMEYARIAMRWVGVDNAVGIETAVPYAVHDWYSLKPHMVLALVVPAFDPQANLYLGISGLLLALAGLALGRQRAEARVAAFLAIGGVLFALGSSDILHGILYSLVPMVEKARSPTMATVVADIGFAMLAAFGLERLLEAREQGWIRTLERAACGAAALIGLFFFVHYIRNDPWGANSRGILTGVAALLFAGCLAAWRNCWWGRSAASGCILGVMYFELGNGYVSYVARASEGYSHLKPLRDSVTMISQFRKLDPLSRVDLSTDDLPYNIGDWHGQEVYYGYLASITRNLFDIGFVDERTRLLFGVRYFAGKSPRGNWSREIARIDNDWRIYENPAAFPRTWVIHQVESAGDHEQLVTWMRRQDINHHEKTVLEGEAPAVERCAAEEWVRVVKHVSSRVTLNADLGCRGMVILGDVYYPGWRATVDGKPVKLYEVYGALRGVVVERGQHVVEMRFRPVSVYLGFALSILGLVAGFLVQRLDPSKS